ncbi:fluoride efflux transporter CrcB [bacterium]|nr:fluoride efflux transporter CrcB [bacterium]
MRHLMIIGCGGFIGAVLRYLISGWIQQIFASRHFPWGTLGVNLIGCFLIGVLGGLVENHELFAPETRLLLLVGILGSFTTFSTFGYESLALIRDQEIAAVFINVIGHVALGIGAAWLGYTATQFS